MLLPSRCIVTGEVVEGQGMISPAAWGALNFIGDPLCYRCGFPFDFDTGAKGKDNLCAGCQKSPPVYYRARAALVYDDASRNIILAFKHADQTQSAPVFTPWLSRVGKEIFEEADYLVPVPLHRWRIWRRRYNQAAILAKYLSKDVKISHMLDAIGRCRATVTQGHLQARERSKNVKNAFVVNSKCLERIKGKNIVLIDDVYTTGATVNECTKVLLKNGAARVDVLTLARVVKPVRA